MNQKTAVSNNSLLDVKTIAKMAILGTAAFVLMMIEFPLPFLAPAFYKMDFSEVAVLVGGFAMGPGPAVVIEALKIVLNLLFQGTSTMFVGELANFLIGCSFVLPAAVLYSKNKNRATALKGLVAGTVCMALMGVIMNYFVLLPAYGYFFHMSEEAIVGAGQAIFPFIKSKLGFVAVCVTPFNLVKGLLVSVVTLLVYKHISPLLHK